MKLQTKNIKLKNMYSPENEQDPIEQDDEQGELFEHYHFDVDKGQSLLRIDKFLANRIEGISRSKIQAAADAGNILVNTKSVKSNYKIKPCDVISIVLPYPKREFELIPENIPIDVIYEDDDLVVLNKEPGMVVHPGHGNYTGTLINALLYKFKDLKGYNDGSQRPGLAHRIDKNTSGILVVAKNELSLNKLAKQFADRTIDRKYIALVWGNFNEKTGTVTGNIGRSVKDKLKMNVFADGSQGKHAVTHFKVVEDFHYVSVIECKLETGRTHQIRVHLEYIGNPVFNDDKYGGDRIVKGTTFAKYKQFIDNCFKIIPRHALHAKSLGFIHPTTGKYMHFESELPTDMADVIDKWRKYSNNFENN